MELNQPQPLREGSSHQHATPSYRILPQDGQQRNPKGRHCIRIGHVFQIGLQSGTDTVKLHALTLTLTPNLTITHTHE